MDRAGTAVRSLIDSRVAAAVGRHARLELRFECRGGRTLLAESYAEPPLRSGTVFAEGSGVHMILTSSAPGIFGGDRFEQRIVVGPGARVRLTSQSALQAHPSPSGEAVDLCARYEVEGDGELLCHWDPLIPFADVRIRQRTHVHLSSNARLYWSDALMSGREARGERWAFVEIDHELRVQRDSRLEYLERYAIVPEGGGPLERWVAGGASYFGTTVATGWELEARDIEQVHGRLQELEGVQAAADLLDRRLAVVRVLGKQGAPFHQARRYAAAVSSAW